MEKMSSLTFPDGSAYEIVDAEARLEVSKTQEVTTDKFNSDIDYVAGDLCIYNNVLYKFITSKSAGEWDSEAVEVTSVKNEMNNLQNQVNALNSKLMGRTLIYIQHITADFVNGTYTCPLMDDDMHTVLGAMAQLKSASAAVITSATYNGAGKGYTIKCSNLTGTAFTGSIAVTLVIYKLAI